MVRRCRLGNSKRALVSRLVGILLLRRFVVFRPRQLFMLGEVNWKFRASIQFRHRSSPWVTIPTVSRKGGGGRELSRRKGDQTTEPNGGDGSKDEPQDLPLSV